MHKQSLPFYVTIIILLITFAINTVQATDGLIEMIDHDPLTTAVMIPDLPEVQKILKRDIYHKEPTPLREARCRKALTWACCTGEKTIANHLLNTLSIFNEATATSIIVQAFIEALSSEDGTSVIELLLEHKNGIKNLDRIGHRLINAAINFKRYSTLNLLLKKGALPDSYTLIKLLGSLKENVSTLKSEDFETVIVCAKMLIDKNIHPAIQEETNSQDSSLHILAGGFTSPHHSSLAKLTRTVLAPCIKDYQLSIKKAFKEHLLLYVPLDDLVNIIRSYIAFVDVRDADDNTPLMIAAQDGNEVLCKLLMKAGANPNAEDRHGNKAFSLLNRDQAAQERLKLFNPEDEIVIDIDSSDYDSIDEESLRLSRFYHGIFITLMVLIVIITRYTIPPQNSEFSI